MKSVIMMMIIAVSSYSFAQVESVGLMIKNRTTKDYLGLACEQRSDNGICQEYAFYTFQRAKDKKSYVPMSKVSSTKSLVTLDRDLRLVRALVYKNARKKTWGGDRLGEIVGEYLRWETFTANVTGQLFFDSAADADSVVGAFLWSLGGVIVAPIGLVIDGSVIAMGSSAYVVTKTVWDLPNHLHATSRAKRTSRLSYQTRRVVKQKKVKSVRNADFEQILSAIR